MHKIKVGITGQAGFMGTHLYNYLNLKDDIELVPFEDAYFEQPEKLLQFAKQCDTIVHLAAMNRHGDPQVIYDTNIRLVQTLLDAVEKAGTKPHILFSSSTQETLDNLYGKSKRDGRLKMEQWAKKNKARFTALVIPNVFGPFGNPYYNSFIATFCHQLTHGEQPHIQTDAEVKLIYINELVEVFYKAISHKLSAISGKVSVYQVPHTSVQKVSEILHLLQKYKTEYFEKGIFPDLSDTFHLVLFNTFRCYMPDDKFPFPLTKNTDDRGSFVEIARTGSAGQFSFSTTKPGITRGNHYHTRKAERFAVIKGKARIQLRRIGTDKVINYDLDGAQPAFVDMPIWTTHNITNTGDDELVTLFWINEPFNPDDPDTFFEIV